MTLHDLAAELMTFASAARELRADSAQVGRWVQRGYLDLVPVDGRAFVTLTSVRRFKAERDAAHAVSAMSTQLAS
jgi:hypothetical protein